MISKKWILIFLLGLGVVLNSFSQTNDQYMPIDQVTGQFTCDFDITPGAETNVTIGLMEEEYAEWGWNNYTAYFFVGEGNIKAGVHMPSDNDTLVVFEPDSTYHISIAGDLTTATYDLSVTKPDGEIVKISQNKTMRSTGKIAYTPASLNFLAFSEVGQIVVENIQSGIVKPKNDQYMPIDPVTGQFTCDFDITPEAETNVTIGLMEEEYAEWGWNNYTAYFFVGEGNIKAGVHMPSDNDTLVVFEPGSTYHISIAGDLTTATYDLSVTKPDGEIVKISQNKTMRSTGKISYTPASLNFLAFSEVGQIVVENISSQNITSSVEKPASLIQSMVLENNFPNPFNPSTEIVFQVPNPGHVHLTVYNVMGQMVKSLVNEVKSAGRYQITWDGTDMTGNHVSGGLYYYSIKSNSTSITKKMLLMK